jgi:hypothetical protein
MWRLEDARSVLQLCAIWAQSMAIILSSSVYSHQKKGDKSKSAILNVQNILATCKPNTACWLSHQLDSIIKKRVLSAKIAKYALILRPL